MSGDLRIRVADPLMQCVFEVDRKNGTLTLTEIAPEVEVEEVESKTDATFTIADDLKIME